MLSSCMLTLSHKSWKQKTFFKPPNILPSLQGKGPINTHRWSWASPTLTANKKLAALLHLGTSYPQKIYELGNWDLTCNFLSEMLGSHQRKWQCFVIWVLPLWVTRICTHAHHIDPNIENAIQTYTLYRVFVPRRITYMCLIELPGMARIFTWPNCFSYGSLRGWRVEEVHTLFNVSMQF